METVVFDQTPLAEYLKDEGDEHQSSWVESVPADAPVSDVDSHDESPPSSPSQFAPVGRPMVKKRFRNKMPDPLRLEIPQYRGGRLNSFQSKYSKALASRIDRADHANFLEQFRYTIVASQLLSGHAPLGQHSVSAPGGAGKSEDAQSQDPGSAGLFAVVAVGFVVAWMINWVYSGGYSHLTKKRVFFVLALLVAAGVLGQAYMRQRYRQHLRGQALSELSSFISTAQDFDSATSAAVSLIQEVELVSRGYRLSAPLPPISRIEDRSQIRRCGRLRKVLKTVYGTVVPKYIQVTSVVKGFSEQLDLEKYYDIYDISDLDISDALQGFSEGDFEDAESLRVLKIAGARFHTIRKMFLCALLALEADADNADLLRWSTAAEGLRTLDGATKEAFERLRTILSEQETFPNIASPRMPLSPGRERWRSQLRKLNSLSTGIRGLQAKLTLLREESDRSLNEAEDVSELGPNLMGQYESIGQDLKLLTQAWEEGRAALASGIDRNEKRLSSLSSILSPTTSLSGLTTVEEGGALEALKALNGETPSPFSSPKESDHEEIFEAVAMPRPRSLLTREERIVKMKEDRERKEAARENVEASRGMLRELEMVINLRPKARTGSKPAAAPGRISL